MNAARLGSICSNGGVEEGVLTMMAVWSQPVNCRMRHEAGAGGGEMCGI